MIRKLAVLFALCVNAFAACQSGFIQITDPYLNPDGTAWTGSITYTLAYNSTIAGSTIVGARQNINVYNGISLCLAPGLYTPVSLNQSGQRYPVTTQWTVPATGGPYTIYQIQGGGGAIGATGPTGLTGSTGATGAAGPATTFADVTAPVVSGPVTVISDGAYNAFPNIVTLASGYLLTTYRKGTSHAADKGSIAGQISTDLGKTWGAQFNVYTDATYNLYSVGLAVLQDGTCLETFYKSVVAGDPVDSYSLKSTDATCTAWGSPVRITTNQSQANSPPIQLSNGYILQGSYQFSGASVQMNRSTDNAATWSVLSTVVACTYDSSCSEPSMVIDTTGPTTACPNCVAGTLNMTIRDMASNAPGTVNTQDATTGLCNANCVTWVSGPTFSTTWGSGTAISIATVSREIQKVYSSTLLSLKTAPGTQMAANYNVTIGYSATTYSTDSGVTWATPTYGAFPAESTAPLVQTPDGCYLTTFRAYTPTVKGDYGTTQYQMGALKNCDGHLAQASWSRQNLTAYSGIGSGSGASAVSWFLYSGMTNLSNGMVGVVSAYQGTPATIANVLFSYMGSSEFDPLQTVQANGVHNTGIEVMEQPAVNSQTRTSSVDQTVYNDSETGGQYGWDITNFTKANPYYWWKFLGTERMSLRYVAGNIRLCLGLVSPCRGSSYPFAVMDNGSFAAAYFGGTATGVAMSGSDTDGNAAKLYSFPNSGSDVALQISTYANRLTSSALLRLTTSGGFDMGTTGDPGAGKTALKPPTSCAGQASGILYNNAGTAAFCP